MKKYIIKIGGMYLTFLKTNFECSDNEFIETLVLGKKRIAIKFNEVNAYNISSKLYIVLGTKCEVIEINETEDN